MQGMRWASVRRRESIAHPRLTAIRRKLLRLLGGHRQQLGELIVANLGLRNQDATAQMLDQIGADRAEPPSRQRPGGTMADDDEVCSVFFGAAADFLPGVPPPPRRRGEANGLEPLHSFRKDRLISRDLFFYRDREASFQGHGAGRNFHNRQQEDLSAAKLRNLRALPQTPSPFN